jgi:hypothetical protein
MNKIICLFVGLAFLSCWGHAQQLQQVAHCPSNEVYDMLLDKKGFIWIAHNLGVSRYDGISFTSFSNPEETSISMTDLLEDRFGRIWCHNFNGQVFYIEHDKMYSLKEYDFRKEVVFPRMILLGDELVVSSIAGLFICNTATMETRYVSLKEKSKVPFDGIGSVCALGDKVLAYGPNEWYLYKPAGGLQRLRSKLKFKGILAQWQNLHPCTIGDTAFLTDKTGEGLYGVGVKEGEVVTWFAKHTVEKVNTISINKARVLINTQKLSFGLYDTDTIKGFALTDMLYDKQGNAWYSSLSDGLLVAYKTKEWHLNDNLKLVDKETSFDFIKKTGRWYFLGNRQGRVFITSSITNAKSEVFKSTLPNNEGIDGVQATDSNSFFIKGATKLFILNALTHSLVYSAPVSVKDVALSNKTAYLASPGALVLKSFDEMKLNLPDNKNEPPFKIADSLLSKSNNEIFLKKKLRSRAVLFDAFTSSLLIAFSDGLQRLKNNKLDYITYNKLPLYTSSLAQYKNKVYAATFNNGLFLINRNDIKKIEDNAKQPLNTIVRLKLCNKHLWIFGPNRVMVLDVETDRFVENMYPFPVDVTEISDVEEDKDNIYLCTRGGLYTMSISANTEVAREDPSLLYMLVNNVDTVFKDRVLLADNNNNLLFRMAIPVYEGAERVYFKYCLINDDIDSLPENGVHWYYTQDAQRDIQFNALKPGSYTLQIITVKDAEVISRKPLVYHFSIAPPWYNTWWFYLVVLLLVISLSVGIYQYRLYQHLKMEGMRRKISNNLHDDIGSTLSSINIYSQLAKSDLGNEDYIDTIQSNTVSIINSLDDLVWNINPKNDILSQLLSRMRLIAVPLLQDKGVECLFNVKLQDNGHVMFPEIRTNIFLLFKEIINNVVKHAACTQCTVNIVQRGKSFHLSVKDNGRGFDVKSANQHRNGMRIMAERVSELKGQLKIISRPGEGTEIIIECNI